MLWCRHNILLWYNCFAILYNAAAPLKNLIGFIDKDCLVTKLTVFGRFHGRNPGPFEVPLISFYRRLQIRSPAYNRCCRRTRIFLCRMDTGQVVHQLPAYIRNFHISNLPYDNLLYAFQRPCILQYSRAAICSASTLKIASGASPGLRNCR